MNRKDFIKSVAFMAGAAAINPSSASASMFQEQTKKKTMMKKSLGIGMIKEELSLTDKFKLAKDLGFDGVEMTTPLDMKLSDVLAAKAKTNIELPSVMNKDHWTL